MTLRKKTISWHEEGLKNSKIYLAQEILILESHKIRVDELQLSINKREKMIAFAKKKGIESFDEKSEIFARII